MRGFAPLRTEPHLRNSLTCCTTHPQTGEKELAPLALKTLTSLVIIAVGAVVLTRACEKKAAQN
jgi:hypothetical protein